MLWSDTHCRVVRVEGPDGVAFPGFCRVIWNGHVAEMSDLAPAERAHLMRVVLRVEQTLRELMQPDKINLASLGNVVPHLHWHVIPRWRDDSHFPRPIWADALRPLPVRPLPESTRFRSALLAALGALPMS